MALTTTPLDGMLKQLRWKRGRNHRLVIAGKCHPEATHVAIYADGVLTLCCQAENCGQAIALIKVAS